MRSFIRKLRTSEQGATAIEYGLIISLVVLAMVGALSQLASSTVGMWDNVANEVSNH